MIVGMARIDKKVIDSLERCKVIVRLGVGFDNIDVPAATARGILVVNIPDFCTEEVSDHAMALILIDCPQGDPRAESRQGRQMGSHGHRFHFL